MRSDRTSVRYPGGFEGGRYVRWPESVIKYHHERTFLGKFSIPVSKQCNNNRGSDIVGPGHHTNKNIVSLQFGGHSGTRMDKVTNNPSPRSPHMAARRARRARGISSGHRGDFDRRVGNFLARNTSPV